MTIVDFPPIDDADEYGLLAIGGDLEVDSLLLAYTKGIFPWPLDDSLLTWFAPEPRAVLFLDHYRPNHRFLRFVKNHPYTIKYNTSFEAVIKGCQEMTNRSNQTGTWITDEIIAGYLGLHKNGNAYSVEVYEGNSLIGGLYGVHIGHFVSAESMFYRKPNASKLAMHHLVQTLADKNISWIDIQVLNDFSLTLGGIEIERTLFMQLLKEALSKEAFCLK